MLLAGLVAGAHNLEVRARIGDGIELRIGRLDPGLTVQIDRLSGLGFSAAFPGVENQCPS